MAQSSLKMFIEMPMDTNSDKRVIANSIVIRNRLFFQIGTAPVFLLWQSKDKGKRIKHCIFKNMVTKLVPLEISIHSPIMKTPKLINLDPETWNAKSILR